MRVFIQVLLVDDRWLTIFVAEMTQYSVLSFSTMDVRQISSRLTGGVRFSPIRRNPAAIPERTHMKRQIDVVCVVGVEDVLSVYRRNLSAEDVGLEETSVETEQRNLYFSNNAPEWAELKTLMEKEGELLGDPSLTQVRQNAWIID